MAEKPFIRPTAYLKRLDVELKKIQKDNEISYDDLEDIIDDFFSIMKEFIEDPRMPKVQITNFGTFKPSLGKINFDIRRGIYKYRAGHLEKQFLIERIQRLWPIRNRIILEKSGVRTWHEWKHKKLEPIGSKNDKKQDQKASDGTL